MTVLYHRPSRCWKIADFGMTVEGSSTRGRTTHFRRGTPCYRAPELFQNIPTFTTKVDIFAIGCIMFEFMTGRRAFGGDMELLKYAAGGEQLDFSPPRFRTGASAFLEALTRQLLNLQVQERPSAQALLQKLSGIPTASSQLMNDRVADREFSFVVSDDGYLRHEANLAQGDLGGIHRVSQFDFLKFTDRRSEILSRTR